MNTLKEYELEIMECLRCKACLTLHPPELYNTTYQLMCPSMERFKFFAYSGGGQAAIAKAIVLGTLDWSPEVAGVMYKCTMCGACREQCLGNFGRIQNPHQYRWTHLIELFQLMRSELVERSLVPPEVRDFLENITLHGNPWGQPGSGRGEWLEQAGIELFKEGDEYLLYLGCLGSYDDRCRKAASSLARLLHQAGLSFGALGEGEGCDGNDVKTLGEEGLFEHLAGGNIERFKEMGVKKIVTFSPHAYNAMKNDYPGLGADFELYHYTQVLWNLIESGRIEPAEQEAVATYHDPCFLGRYNGIYEEPRNILASIPGMELQEMVRSKEKSYCCGGGGGGFCTDYLGGSERSPSRRRLREAYDTQARVLAVACPACLTMLEDALAAEGLEEEMKVKDISELVAGDSS